MPGCRHAWSYCILEPILETRRGFASNFFQNTPENGVLVIAFFRGQWSQSSRHDAILCVFLPKNTAENGVLFDFIHGEIRSATYGFGLGWAGWAGWVAG